MSSPFFYFTVVFLWAWNLARNPDFWFMNMSSEIAIWINLDLDHNLWFCFFKWKFKGVADHPRAPDHREIGAGHPMWQMPRASGWDSAGCLFVGWLVGWFGLTLVLFLSLVWFASVCLFDVDVDVVVVARIGQFEGFLHPPMAVSWEREFNITCECFLDVYYLARQHHWRTVRWACSPGSGKNMFFLKLVFRLDNWNHGILLPLLPCHV